MKRKKFNDEIQSAIKDNSLKTITKDVEITCEKVDGKWLVVSDENLANIMLANMYTVFSDLANSFNGESK